MPASSLTAANNALETSAPVASPPACRIRFLRCPPSLVNAISPVSDLSKTAPCAINFLTASGPSETKTSTALMSHKPAPAAKVSFLCCSGVSPGPSAAAMPPCAHLVDPASIRALVTNKTDKP